MLLFKKIPALPTYVLSFETFAGGKKEKEEERYIASHIHFLEMYNSLKHIKVSENSSIRNIFERNRSTRNRFVFVWFNLVFFKKKLVINLNKSPLVKTQGEYQSKVTF